MVGKHLLTLADFEAREIEALLGLSDELKAKMRSGGAVLEPLKGRSLAMIFQKRSTRTRVSTETGMARLGGTALFLGSDDIQLGANETIKDTGLVLSRFNDGILARVFGHETVEELAEHSSAPVINALSDKYHPLQALADVMTLREHFGGTKGLRLAWVGDGNNIIHSLLACGPKLGMHLSVATPPGYECDEGVVARATAESAELGTSLAFTADPLEAVRGADVIVTDTWVSMGQEGEKEARLREFEGYQVTEAMARDGGASPGWRFLHCLPRKPEEVDDEVFYSARSLVFDEAENRMWTVMAVLLAQMKGGL